MRFSAQHLEFKSSIPTGTGRTQAFPVKGSVPIKAIAAGCPESSKGRQTDPKGPVVEAARPSNSGSYFFGLKETEWRHRLVTGDSTFSQKQGDGEKGTHPPSASSSARLSKTPFTYAFVAGPLFPLTSRLEAGQRQSDGHL